jgi:MFS family permease
MKTSRYRWFVLSTLFLFVLLHQADKLLIGPLTTPIMEAFGIDEARMGLVFSGAVIVGAIFYPIWGYLYDRFIRARLLALAAFIWGATTWISAVVRTYTGFLFSRASTGIDDSSYPGLYNLMADYFGPKVRGKINGLLQIAQPLGYLLGMVLALLLGKVLGWRMVFIITGSLGIVLAFVIFFTVKEPVRGASEPEMKGVEQKTAHKFSWKAAFGLFKKRSLLFVFANGFAGVFPWQVIQFWIFRYLQKERGYNETEVLLTMVSAIIVLALGYPLGGAIGDALFKRTPRGRIIASFSGVILGAVFLFIALQIPVGDKLTFGIVLGLTALFMPFAAPNVLSTVYDVTVPEVRSTANAVLNFFEQIGSSIAPALAGYIAVKVSLGSAILSISVSAWLVCFVILVITSLLVPKDIAALRAELRQRAAAETGNGG